VADVSWGHGNIAGAPATIDPLDPRRVALSPPAALIDVGDTARYTATAFYSDGSSVDVTSLGQWSVADLSVAKIDATGLLTGVGAGATAVRFSYGTATARADATVFAVLPQQSDDDWWWLV